MGEALLVQEFQPADHTLENSKHNVLKRSEAEVSGIW